MKSSNLHPVMEAALAPFAPKALESLTEIVTRLDHWEQMRCNCDLDNWQPEASTGHSQVCRIHKAAISQYRKARGLGS